MAEHSFQEVIREFQRMCKTIRNTQGSCEKCPIKIATYETIFMCYRYIEEFPEIAESIVMSWAAEHPELVYPTWEEWLQSVGVMESSEGLLRRIKSQLLIDGIPAHAVPTSKILQPMDAYIAQKLGIEPKER